jgi:hypothetical protein
MGRKTPSNDYQNYLLVRVLTRMRVLVLKTSFVLVGWINILAELTQSGKRVSDVEADADIKHFLSATLKECVGDD